MLGEKRGFTGGADQTERSFDSADSFLFIRDHRGHGL